MCEPATLALMSMGLTIAGTAYGAQQQNKAANQQARAIGLQAQADANAQQLQMQQVGYQAAEEMNQRNRQAMVEAATFDAITGEFGGGATASRQAAELAFNRNQDLGTITTNRDNTLSQIGQESRGAALRSRAQLASLQRPTYPGTALTIAGNAANSGGGQFLMGEYIAGQKNARAKQAEEPRRIEWARNNRPNRAGA